MSRIDRLAAFFRPSSGVPAGERAAKLLAPATFLRSRVLVQAYYAALLYLAVANLFSWKDLLQARELTPRWPVRWLAWVDLESGIGWILALHLIAAILGVSLGRFRAVRVIVFIALLEFVAFRFSFGAVNHGDHLGVLLSFVLIFLPDGWHQDTAPRPIRAATALVLSTCMSLILLTYSMSGFWKLGAVVRQAAVGEVHALHPRGLAQQIAAKLLDTDTTSVLGPWLIEHYWVGWLLMVGTLYVELFALWIVFRPALHRLWGVALIVFHISTHLTMEVGFPQNSLWIALFLLASPFAPAGWEWRRALRELPVVGPRLSR